MELEYEVHDNPLDYEVEDEDFYETPPPLKKLKCERRVTFKEHV